MLVLDDYLALFRIVRWRGVSWLSDCILLYQKPIKASVFIYIWAASWQKQQNGICAQRRLRSAWASAQSDQSLRCDPPSLIRVFAVRSVASKGPKLSSCGQWRLWSDWADAQADLNLRWAHMPFCWIYHEAAHLVIRIIVSVVLLLSRLMSCVGCGMFLVIAFSSTLHSSMFQCYSIIIEPLHEKTCLRGLRSGKT